MGTGKKNTKYYDGYEGEVKITLEKIEKGYSMEIWEGYFTDFLNMPDVSGTGWKGFTKDYHQCEGIWGDDEGKITINVNEYLADIKEYIGKSYDYPETSEMINELAEFLASSVREKATIEAGLEY